MFAPAHDLVTAPEVTPRRWMAFLHGIYGRGANWRTIARKLSGARPDWGYVLVDLRMHGQSQDAPPPHTLAAAAEDVAALEVDGRPVQAVCGHSFGGKVALEVRGRALVDVAHTFVLDASPSPRAGMLGDTEDTVVRVLSLLAELDGPFASRDDFVDAVERRGFSLGLAQWLAMNLESRPHGYEMVLDPAPLRALLADYAGRDLWAAAAADGGPGTLDLVVAGGSAAVSAADRQRFAGLAAGAPDRLALHEIADAGHWLHVEAGDQVVDILAARLGE